ncbi:unnamed protein product [Prorocentrum cordatum]|uniref:Uncharacterized protein n=1 Tax=Prorocentrum cordatum TaxID=2364126 RepID=A0ABN9SP31_9DINO|nr:unnamed protein product [Polarella glacialis]
MLGGPLAAAADRVRSTAFRWFQQRCPALYGVSASRVATFCHRSSPHYSAVDKFLAILGVLECSLISGSPGELQSERAPGFSGAEAPGMDRLCASTPGRSALRRDPFPPQTPPPPPAPPRCPPGGAVACRARGRAVGAAGLLRRGRARAGGVPRRAARGGATAGGAAAELPQPAKATLGMHPCKIGYSFGFFADARCAAGCSLLRQKGAREWSSGSTQRRKCGRCFSPE